MKRSKQTVPWASLRRWLPGSPWASPKPPRASRSSPRRTWALSFAFLRGFGFGVGYGGLAWDMGFQSSGLGDLVFSAQGPDRSLLRVVLLRGLFGLRVQSLAALACSRTFSHRPDSSSTTIPNRRTSCWTVHVNNLRAALSNTSSRPNVHRDAQRQAHKSEQESAVREGRGTHFFGNYHVLSGISLGCDERACIGACGSCPGNLNHVEGVYSGAYCLKGISGV